MINKERLKELIEQGATIYFVYNGNVDEKEGVYKDDFILNETYVSIYWTTRNHQVKYENLFETKEEAEWYKEFGSIERTERLELPTWEEAQRNLEIEIYAPKGKKYLLETKIKVGYSVDKENPYIIRIDRVGYANSQIDFEYSKENYIEACRVAKKLFLGEE